MSYFDASRLDALPSGQTSLAGRFKPKVCLMRRDC
jgi:hypothetical protein